MGFDLGRLMSGNHVQAWESIAFERMRVRVCVFGASWSCRKIPRLVLLWMAMLEARLWYSGLLAFSMVMSDCFL